jgi:hypothetical protein
VVIIQSMTRDEVSYHPTAAVLVVVEIHQAVIGDNVWAAYNDPVIAASSMVVVVRVNRHLVDSVAESRQNLHCALWNLGFDRDLRTSNFEHPAALALLSLGKQAQDEIRDEQANPFGDLGVTAPAAAAVSETLPF